METLSACILQKEAQFKVLFYILRVLSTTGFKVRQNELYIPIFLWKSYQTNTRRLEAYAESVSAVDSEPRPPKLNKGELGLKDKKRFLGLAFDRKLAQRYLQGQDSFHCILHL